jgi:hypothetical protein
MLIKGVYRLKLHLSNTTVLKNNAIDAPNNCILAIDAIIKYPSYLLGSKAILIIQYRTTRFKSIYTKS